MIFDFRQLRETVMDNEEEEAEHRKLHGQYKKNNGRGSGSEIAEVNTIQKRHFSDMGKPLAQMLEELEKKIC